MSSVTALLAAVAVFIGACTPAADDAAETTAKTNVPPVTGTDRTAAPSQEPMPAAVTAWLQTARSECERGGGTFRDGDYWQAGDFNGDGQPDFLLTRAALGCEGNDIFSGGTAGDTYEVLVSSANGYALAGGGILAHDAEVAQRDGKTVVLTPDDEDGRIKHHWAWDGTKLAINGNTDGPL